jgi:transcription termination factor Rho
MSRPEHQNQPQQQPQRTPEIGSGFLEVAEKGFGFLRSIDNKFQPKPTDVFVTPDCIKKNFLREGVLVEGRLQPPHRGSSPQLREVINRQRPALHGIHQAVPLREPHLH